MARETQITTHSARTHTHTNTIILTEIDGPLISRKSILRNKSHSTSSSTDGYRLSGDSKIICNTSTTYINSKVQIQLTAQFAGKLNICVKSSNVIGYTLLANVQYYVISMVYA